MENDQQCNCCKTNCQGRQYEIEVPAFQKWEIITQDAKGKGMGPVTIRVIEHECNLGNDQ